jgi:hypothetical protein
MHDKLGDLRPPGWRQMLDLFNDLPRVRTFKITALF